jgi:hypothetical protein
MSNYFLSMGRVLSVLCFLVLLGGCSLKEKDVVDIRVDAALNGLKEKGLTKPYQTAICMWAEGKYTIANREHLERAMTGYDNWVKEKDLKLPITTYEIKEIEIVEDTSVPTAIVAVTIDGKEYKLQVCDNAAISWVK